MQPLKITANLAETKLSALNLSLPIDGPLAWALMREKDKEKVLNPCYGTREWVDIDLSKVLKQITLHGHKFYSCSWAIFEKRKEYIKYRHRRFDMEHVERYVDMSKRRGGKVITAGGPFKTRRIPQIVVCTDKLVWYCVGKKERIKELLKAVTHIGSARAAGFGGVREWLVEPWSADWSVYGPGGSLMRAIPAPDGDMVCSIRPPYWTPEKVRCRAPEFTADMIKELIT